MRVKFSEVFDYVPSGDRRVVIRHRPDGGVEKDGVYTVKRECGEAAVAAGKASEVEPFNGADPAAFDHDKDGKPGGSLPGRRSRARAK